MRYCWSKDEEGFTGDFETREEALAEAKRENPEYTVFWTGEAQPKTAAYFITVDHLLEDMQGQADDVAGEASEDWLPDWRSQVDTQDELKAIIAKFVDEHWPVKFFSVDKIEKHEAAPDA